jgi:hypothetical protein
MRAFLLGAAVLALAACGSTSDNDPNDPNDPVDPQDPTDPDDPPTPDESARDSDELASILAAHVRGEFPMQLIAAEISKNRFPEGFSQTGTTAEGAYTGVGAQGGLSFAFDYRCNDGTTAHLIVPCDGTAHHSHIKFTVTGSQSMGEIAMNEINRVVDWEIRDLTLDKARFRGPDGLSLKTAVTTNGEAASYGVQFNATYEQVRYLVGYTFPTFGTIDFTVNTNRMRGDDKRVFNSTAKLTFGSSGVPTTLALDGVNYTINLTSGAVVRL